MAVAPAERLNFPVSDAELERRWRGLRAAMAEAGIDVLVTQNNNDHMGGYVKYLTDLSATNGYPVSVVFPRDDLMTLVRQGPFGGIDEPISGNGIYRGIKQVLHTPSFATASYCFQYDSELLLRALKAYAKARIGLVCTYQFGHAHVEHLKAALPQASFIEATDIVDRFRAVKSAEELDMIRRTAALQDKAIKAAFDAIEPGMRESDVAAVARFTAEKLGSEQGIYLCCSAPAETPLRLGQRHFQNRRLKKGDQYILLVETNGPGGQYTEIGRTCVLGKVPSRLADEFAFTLEARRHVLAAIRPGVRADDVFASYCDFMRRNGRPEEKRLFAHNQGCDMVERPLIRQDETMSFAAGMNLAIHPSYVNKGVMSWICDNYILGEDGTLERIHAFPEVIVER
ncbi:MAG TPA: M24 family metallopeptidase [Hyphomicrobiaceae bacterium]|nr:M24 family metallopeptidase [Hyphomicrobiaceae bacterium]